MRRAAAAARGSLGLRLRSAARLKLTVEQLVVQAQRECRRLARHGAPQPLAELAQVAIRLYWDGRSSTRRGSCGGSCGSIAGRTFLSSTSRRVVRAARLLEDGLGIGYGVGTGYGVGIG